MADRILIVQTKRIGDLALTAPVVASIRCQLPGAEITLVAQGAAGALAPLVPAIDHSVVLSGNWLETRPWLELWGRDFDAAIDLSATDRSRLALEISGAPQRIGFEKWQRRRLLGQAPPYNIPIPGTIGQRHISAFFASSLTGLGLKPETAPAALETPLGFDRTRDQLADLKSRAPLALVHPGTTEPGKFWRPELWARTIAHLVRTHGFQVILSQGRQPTEQHHLIPMSKRNW